MASVIDAPIAPLRPLSPASRLQKPGTTLVDPTSGMRRPQSAHPQMLKRQQVPKEGAGNLPPSAALKPAQTGTPPRPGTALGVRDGGTAAAASPGLERVSSSSRDSDLQVAGDIPPRGGGAGGGEHSAPPPIPAGRFRSHTPTLRRGLGGALGTWGIEQLRDDVQEAARQIAAMDSSAAPAVQKPRGSAGSESRETLLEELLHKQAQLLRCALADLPTQVAASAAPAPAAGAVRPGSTVALAAAAPSRDAAQLGFVAGGARVGYGAAADGPLAAVVGMVHRARQLYEERAEQEVELQTTKCELNKLLDEREMMAAAMSHGSGAQRRQRVAGALLKSPTHSDENEGKIREAQERAAVAEARAAEAEARAAEAERRAAEAESQAPDLWRRRSSGSAGALSSAGSSADSNARLPSVPGGSRQNSQDLQAAQLVSAASHDEAQQRQQVAVAAAAAAARVAALEAQLKQEQVRAAEAEARATAAQEHARAAGLSEARARAAANELEERVVKRECAAKEQLDRAATAQKEGATIAARAVARENAARQAERSADERARASAEKEQAAAARERQAVEVERKAEARAAAAEAEVAKLRALLQTADDRSRLSESTKRPPAVTESSGNCAGSGATNFNALASEEVDEASVAGAAKSGALYSATGSVVHADMDTVPVVQEASSSTAQEEQPRSVDEAVAVRSEGDATPESLDRSLKMHEEANQLCPVAAEALGDIGFREAKGYACAEETTAGSIPEGDSVREGAEGLAGRLAKAEAQLRERNSELRGLHVKLAAAEAAARAEVGADGAPGGIRRASGWPGQASLGPRAAEQGPRVQVEARRREAQEARLALHSKSMRVRALEEEAACARQTLATLAEENAALKEQATLGATGAPSAESCSAVEVLEKGLRAEQARGEQERSSREAAEAARDELKIQCTALRDKVAALLRRVEAADGALVEAERGREESRAVQHGHRMRMRALYDLRLKDIEARQREFQDSLLEDLESKSNAAARPPSSDPGPSHAHLNVRPSTAVADTRQRAPLARTYGGGLGGSFSSGGGGGPGPPREVVRPHTALRARVHPAYVGVMSASSALAVHSASFSGTRGGRAGMGGRAASRLQRPSTSVGVRRT